MVPFRIFFPLLALLTVTTGLRAQSDTLGQWRSLQSFSTGQYVTESDEAIVYTTGQAVFFLDKEDLSITTLTKTDGLTETRVRLVRYDPVTATLIIVYQSGVIDLLRSGNLTTLRQIDNFNFNGDKQIYDVFVDADGVAYFSAGFGLTALDLREETFLFTTFTGVRVNAAVLYRDQLYAATAEGIYRVDRTGVNLNDFGNWRLLGPEFGLPADYGTTALGIWRDELYLAVDKQVYQWNDGDARVFFETDGSRPWAVEYISPGPTRLLIGYRCTDAACGSRQFLIFDGDGNQERRIISGCIFRANYAIEDERGRIWFGDDAESIRYLESPSSGDCQQLTYPGPPDDANFRLYHDGSALWVAPSVLDNNFGPRFTGSAAYRFQEESWTVFDRNNTDAFLGRDGARGGNDNVFAIVDIHRDNKGQYWLSSFFEGAIRFDPETGESMLFDESNSSLQTAIGEAASRVRVAAAVTDDNGFTYLANALARDGDFISVRDPQGNWTALGGGCNANEALDMIVTPDGDLWTIHAVGNDNGLTVLNTNGTPTDPSDDRCRTFTPSNSNLQTNSVRSIAVGQQGEVWVGTTQGIIIFDCQGEFAFDAERCPGELPPSLADDGFGGTLFETEEIRAIAVDGANRKWVGTANGVYLLSPRGLEQLAFFDEDNSPLLDNLVRDIAIDPNSGTVYFGTDRGIVSFRGEATEGEGFFPDELTVFPNPVEPGYDGPIAVTGLQPNARVKITDVSGKLVFEGTALGGQFTWDGRDYTGRRVSSGVYYAYASTGSAGGLGLTDPAGSVGRIVFIQ